MLFTVREAYGQVLGEVRGPTFPRPRSRTLSGEVLWSPFGVFFTILEFLWGPFWDHFASKMLTLGHRRGEIPKVVSPLP